MLDRARGGHHDVGRPIVTGEVGAQLAPVKRPHRFRRAQDGTAERLVGKRDELQMLENEIVGRIGDCADLLYDDVLLAQQFLAIERRLGKDIGEHVQRQRYIGFEDARVIGGAFSPGRGIEIATDGFDLFRDLPGAAPARALEGHMFKEMGNAVLVALLVAAAGSDPNAQRRGLEVRHCVGHHIDAGLQSGHLDAHAAAPSCAARLVARTNFSTAD